MRRSIKIASPLGPLCLHEEFGRLVALNGRADSNDSSALLRRAADQLRAYFAGELHTFDLPFDWGTGLQQKVRLAMAMIPYGETRTYGDLAKQVGAPPQAIGQACGANPLPIFIPCHRVLGAKGLGGFSAQGGVETKVWLLRHEKAAGLLI
jgi:methylated-DNA-[protein]-cysteine S-methyltransferase